MRTHKIIRGLALVVLVGLILLPGGQLWALSSTTLTNGADFTLEVTGEYFETGDTLPTELSGFDFMGYHYAYFFSIEVTGPADLSQVFFSQVAYNYAGHISGVTLVENPVGTADFSSGTTVAPNPWPSSLGFGDNTDPAGDPILDFLIADFQGNEVNTGEFTDLIYFLGDFAPIDEHGNPVFLQLLALDTGDDAMGEIQGPTTLGVQWDPSTSVPEPNAILLLGAGVLTAAILLRRKSSTTG